MQLLHKMALNPHWRPARGSSNESITYPETMGAAKYPKMLKKIWPNAEEAFWCYLGTQLTMIP